MLTCFFDEARGAWEVVDAYTNEWIFEGTYEQCEKMVNEGNAAWLEEGGL